MMDNIATALTLTIILFNIVSVYRSVKHGFPLLNSIQVVARTYMGTMYLSRKILMVNATSYVLAYMGMEYFQLVKAFWTIAISLAIALVLDIVCTLLLAVINKRKAQQDRS